MEGSSMLDNFLEPRDRQLVRILLVLAVVCTLVQHTLWTRLTTRLPTLTTSVLFYMAVPVTLVFGVVLLGERVTAWMLGGAALIVSGNLLALLRRRRS